MLTKTDLQQIREVVGEEIDEKLDKKLKPIKRDISYLKKTLSIAIRRFDETDVNHERRIVKIENHLGLPTKN